MAKILIVEDENLLADLYKDKFAEEGMEADIAHSAEEAMEYLKTKEAPNLILLDILLPRENGISFLKEMKEHKELPEIPVVAFSNYDEPQTKADAFKLGVKAYLLKAKYTPTEMVEAIKNFLSSADDE